MTKYNFYQQLYSLLFLLVFIMSCNGQNQTPLNIKSKTTAYGFSDIVQSMFQDKSGNMWWWAIRFYGETT